MTSPVARTWPTSSSVILRSNMRWMAWTRKTSGLYAIVRPLHILPDLCLQLRRLCDLFLQIRARPVHLLLELLVAGVDACGGQAPDQSASLSGQPCYPLVSRPKSQGAPA